MLAVAVGAGVALAVVGAALAGFERGRRAGRMAQAGRVAALERALRAVQVEEAIRRAAERTRRTCYAVRVDGRAWWVRVHPN